MVRESDVEIRDGDAENLISSNYNKYDKYNK